MVRNLGLETSEKAIRLVGTNECGLAAFWLSVVREGARRRASGPRTACLEVERVETNVTLPTCRPVVPINEVHT
jgi:hypothetical protein